MREWFDSLEPREQLIVGLGGLLLALILYWLLLWEPLSRQSRALDQNIAEQRELIGYLQSAGLEARSLGAGQGGRASAGRSLLATVDGSSKQSGLNAYIKRIQPEGQSSVRLWIEEAPFEALARWLDQLRSQHGIALDNGSLDRADRAGTVKARLTLVREGT